MNNPYGDCAPKKALAVGGKVMVIVLFGTLRLPSVPKHEEFVFLEALSVNDEVDENIFSLPNQKFTRRKF
ncbi:hypothetical protein TNCV_2552661 [Trichonephila clavipes]|nr:hypothetical protein TNCV_2552661 [Trichonephila clavipes]